MKAFTLVELLLALSLAGVVILGFTSLDTFGRYQVMTADRLAKAQNELSLVADHMSKQVSRGIGNEVLFGASSVATTANIGTYDAIRVRVDANNNGVRDGSDPWIAYRWRNAGADRYQLQYCSQCQNANCVNCNSGWQVLSRNVIFFSPLYISGDNFANVAVETCWDPEQAMYMCSEPLNPTSEAELNIKMPAVSLN